MRWRSRATALPQRVARVVGLEVGEQPRRQLDLVGRRQGGVEHERGAALARELDLVVELGGHDRRQHHQRQRDAGVAQRQQRGRLRARALVEQLAGQRREAPCRCPKPASSWGSIVQQRRRLRAGTPARAIPPATSTQPASARASGAPRTDEPATRRQRQHGHGRRRGQRLDAPAADQQQHEQEHDRRHRARQQRQRGAGEHVARRARQRLAHGGDRARQPAPGPPPARSAPGRRRSRASRTARSGRRRARGRRRCRPRRRPPRAAARRRRRRGRRRPPPAAPRRPAPGARA